MTNSIATLGIKVDPRQAILGSSIAQRAITGVGGAAKRAQSAVFSLQGALVGLGGAAALRSIITTAAEVESLQIRLKFLTGSTEDAAEAFDIMNDFASKVPFSLQDIERASPSLLTVADNVGELNELLAITGDIAAVSGLTFDETAMQIQRAMSAGIASADQFRERGISAFLGFESGVSISAEKTKQRIKDMWRDGTTTAVGATSELAGTFTGQVSMMEDAWRDMKLVVADTGVFEEASKVILGVTEGLRDPAFKSGVESFSKNMLGLFQFSVDHKDELLAVGAMFLGSKVGGVLGKQASMLVAAGAGAYAYRNELAQLLGLQVETGTLDSIEEVNSAISLINDKMSNSYQKHQGGFISTHGYELQIEGLKAQANELFLLREKLQDKGLVIEMSLPITASKEDHAIARQKTTDRKLLGMRQAHFGAIQMEQTRYEAHQAELARKTLDAGHLMLQKQSLLQAEAAKHIKSEWQEVGEAIQSSWDSVGMSIENSLADSILGLSSWKDATKSILQDVAREFVKTYILKGAVAGISGAIGGALGLNSTPAAETGSLNLSNATYGLKTFDGGGFTGSGSRSGGVDGKGGFPAILHPNETVVDHTKGQSADSGGKTVIVQQTINITTGIQQTVRAEISNLMPDIANAAKSAVYEAQQRGAFG